MSRINAATTDLATNWLPAMRALGEYRGGMNEVRRAEARHVMSATAAEHDVDEGKIRAARAGAAAAWKRYESTITEDAERKLADAIVAAEKAYADTVDRVLPVSRAGRGDEARMTYRTDSSKRFGELMAALDRDVEFQTKGGDAAYKGSQEHYTQTRGLVLAVMAVAFLFGAVLAWLITRSITRPIASAVAVAETVAGGDLTSRIEVVGNDETAQLLAALRRMNQRLSEIVEQVRGSSDSIATGTAQIATGNADLSQRTEEQASNLQQTAASMEQLTSTVKQNAETARQATQLAAGASDAALEGGHVVQRVVETMYTISGSSRKIADIIGVIDGIAFQTNILALNASVEAARAGEQGRGFAVVAGEVRSLAQRSAQAAREIKSLIHESVGNVETGAALVGDAGKAMSGIVAQVKRVTDLIAEISAASNEQTAGIGQIGDAVTQLDQVTQQNAALVEESAAAAESLRHQASRLTEAVALFKTAGNGAAPAHRPVEKRVAAPAAAAPGARRAAASVPQAPQRAAADEQWETF
jgi:methyl-accepting chemotaxis protein